MTTREEIAWLARRGGWGLAPGELDELEAAGTDLFLDALIDPDGAGIDPSSPPFESFVFTGADNRREDNHAAFSMWLDHLETTERPLEDAMAWFWHDHFAVSLQVVQYLPSMLDHLEVLRGHALGSFASMLRAVTIDPAMLLFLDGATSTGRAPNENYGRELLELYALGIGNYTEDDIQAAAAALTGWVVRRRQDWAATFVANRHDDSPQTFLGVDRVHDVDTVIDATLAHDAVPGYIAGKLGRYLLGASVDPGVVAAAADTFAAEDMALAPTARSLLQSGLDGAGESIVLQPLHWLLQALKATGAEMEIRRKSGLLRAMDQIPGAPPNVAGYPGASTWLASSATAARFTSANFVANATPDDSAALAAAAGRRWDELADLLLRPEGFSASTRAALDDLAAGASPRSGEAHLALALASPDLLIA